MIHFHFLALSYQVAVITLVATHHSIEKEDGAVSVANQQVLFWFLYSYTNFSCSY